MVAGAVDAGFVSARAAKHVATANTAIAPVARSPALVMFFMLPNPFATLFPESSTFGAEGSGYLARKLLVDAAGQESAIDHDGLPGHERRSIGGQIEDGSHHLFGLAEAAHGRAHQ